MKVTIKKAALEKELEKIKKELQTIENSPAFRKEKLVVQALAELMKKHGCSKTDLISLLQNQDSNPGGRAKSRLAPTRKRRKLKVFKNPETGEIVETRGGNHKVLKTWKAQYNLSSIEEWLIQTKS